MKNIRINLGIMIFAFVVALWKPTTNEFSFGNLKKRHGTILPITKSEYGAILAKWGK